MNPELLDSREVIDSQVQGEQVEQYNSQLCQQCQGWSQWSGIDKYETPMQYDVSCRDLLRNDHCLVCKCVLGVINVRIQWSTPVQDIQESEILIRISGPFYLDQFVSSQTSQYRIDSLDTTHITIPLWVQLEVEIHRDERVLSQGDLGNGKDSPFQTPKRPPPIITSTPQLRAYYVKGGTPQLCDLKHWEEPYFKVQTLREWIRNCQTCHGGHCSSTSRRGKLSTVLKLHSLYSVSQFYSSYAIGFQSHRH